MRVEYKLCTLECQYLQCQITVAYPLSQLKSGNQRIEGFLKQSMHDVLPGIELDNSRLLVARNNHYTIRQNQLSLC